MFKKIAQFIADRKINRNARKAEARGMEAQRHEAMIFQASRGKGFGA